MTSPRPSAAPEVSVVMGVFNSADSLPATVESILSQSDVELEFLAVDDGSTDASAEILGSYAARDPRLRLIRQDHGGLTAALINGCRQARGVFIARQDAGGDYSMPARLSRQAAVLRSRPDVAMTACGTLWLGPEGEQLWTAVQDEEELYEGVSATSPERIRGPSHHGAVMFRADAYRRVGGYRAAFVVAQDLDLWSRLAEVGGCVATPEIGYAAAIARSSITQLHRERQREATEVIVRCARARRAGRNDAELLQSLPALVPPSNSPCAARRRDAALYYFIGSVLLTRSPERARRYFRKALRRWPLHWRAGLKFLYPSVVPAGAAQHKGQKRL